MFKSEIETKLKEKGLTESSMKIYVRNLEKLNGGEMKNFNFLKNVEGILEKLTKYKDNTRRSYLISIVSILGVMKGENKPFIKLHKLYQDKMMNTDKEIRAKPADEKSETQKENWVSWEEVESKLNELKEKLNFGKKKALNEGDFNNLLSYVILSLYVYQAPRRNTDYLKMNIVKTNKDETDKNFLVLDTNEFVFNVYKTFKKEGIVRIKLSDNMKEVIDLYLKHHPLIKKKMTKTDSIPFLVYHDGKPFELINSITRILNKVFGKNVGSSLLRSSYLTDKYGDLKKEQQKDAIEMGHSVETQQGVYVKK